MFLWGDRKRVAKTSLTVSCQQTVNISSRKTFQLKIMKFSIALLLTLAIFCAGQNMTELKTKCDRDVEIWKNEAQKWHNQYIGFIICSSLVWFLTLVSIWWWGERKWDIDSRKRLGFWGDWRMNSKYLPQNGLL